MMSWDIHFANPIELPSGKLLFTLRDAGLHIVGLPKAEQNKPAWQNAMHVLIQAADHLGPARHDYKADLILMETVLLLSVVGEFRGIGIVQQPRDPPALNIPAFTGSSPEAVGSDDEAGLSDWIEALEIVDHLRRSCVTYRTQQEESHYVPSSAPMASITSSRRKPVRTGPPDAPNGQDASVHSSVDAQLDGFASLHDFRIDSGRWRSSLKHHGTDRPGKAVPSLRIANGAGAAAGRARPAHAALLRVRRPRSDQERSGKLDQGRASPAKIGRGSRFDRAC
ncbi:hypothetical protein ONR75_19925 [Rhodopseudomonas sp. P2A-2r]|uniref:hypothetical protein n=1 Tax=Rhodopseudomonas sp. P2A-2r TaxID=2991972 RepID=UPI002234347C|nr:hypothetical protein [Rhodopseudomonas sp. P2A-2r]UZE47232.1 hypothetical protein ONR75_19925 [Rhodopseudomonas sp. P2A-2r]